MPDVVSLGSVNVDRVAYLDGEVIAAIGREAGWFPRPGETVSLEWVPDAFADRSFETFLGGKGANQALAARGAGADVAFVGAVGDDSAAGDVLASLRDAGVDTDGVEVADAPTGRAFVFVDETGENRIVVVPGANGRIDPAFVRRHYDRIAAADCLLLQNEIPVAAMDALLDDLDGEAPSDRPTVVFDPAPADGAEGLLHHRSVDVVTPNETEYEELSPWLADFDGVVVRTREERAVVVEAGVDFRVTPPTVEPVDSTAAGDVFNGFLAAGLVDGAELREAVETATIAASLSTEAEGAQRSIPAREVVERLVS